MPDRTVKRMSVLPRAVFLPAVILFLLFLARPVSSAEETSAVPGKYSHAIQRISLNYGINPRFVQALIWRESRFSANATGAHGEIGLMQIKMETARDWAKKHNRPVPFRDQVYGVELNLSIGIWHLDQAMRNWEGYPDQAKLSLLEYNVGRTALLRCLAHHDGDVEALLHAYRSHSYPDDILAKFVEYSRMGQKDLACYP